MEGMQLLYSHSTAVDVPDPLGIKTLKFLEWTYNQSVSNTTATKRGFSDDRAFSAP
jgi:hypothetical protein